MVISVTKNIELNRKRNYAVSEVGTDSGIFNVNFSVHSLTHFYSSLNKCIDEYI